MFKKFLKENFITIFCAVGGVFILAGFIWACFALHGPGTNILILHFDDLNGITGVGEFGFIIFMGIFGLLVVGMNFAIAHEFVPRNQFLGRFLAVMTLLFGVLLFIGFAAIINVNV